MDEQVASLADEIGVELDDEAGAQDLIAAINRELGDLQAAELSVSQKERQLVLMAARQKALHLRSASQPSTDVVLSRAAFDSLLAVAVANATRVGEQSSAPAGTDEVKTMRDHFVAAATKASRDYSRRVTVPLTIFSLVVAAAWSAKGAFGVVVPKVSFASWTITSLVALALCACVWGLAWMERLIDSGELRLLYLPESQEAALRRAATMKDVRMGRVTAKGAKVINGRVTIDRGGYESALMHVVAFDSPMKIGSIPVFVAIQVVRRFFSNVDRTAAADDATELALLRLVKLGLLEPIVHRNSTRYVVTEPPTPDEREPPKQSAS